MIFRKNVKTPTLAFLGAAVLAAWSTLQHFLNRAGHTSDFTDFCLGVLLGIGVGLMILVAWRSGRRRRGESPGTCAK